MLLQGSFSTIFCMLNFQAAWLSGLSSRLLEAYFWSTWLELSLSDFSACLCNIGLICFFLFLLWIILALFSSTLHVEDFHVRCLWLSQLFALLWRSCNLFNLVTHRCRHWKWDAFSESDGNVQGKRTRFFSLPFPNLCYSISPNAAPRNISEGNLKLSSHTCHIPT